ncbi:hypothetical protein V2G26_007093 [Clonostachys chloroleuca]
MNGYVDYSEAESILQQLHLSAQELRSRNQQRLHSFLDGPPVWYIHGRHRVKAVKSIGPDDMIIRSLASLRRAWAGYGDFYLQTVRELEGTLPAEVLRSPICRGTLPFRSSLQPSH